MDKKTEIRRKRDRRRLRASIFLRRNGLYIAAAICLAMLGGVSALILGGRGGNDSPAERSYDERLSSVSPSPSAKPDAVPSHLPTSAPTTVPTTAPEPTPVPTPIPDFTPAPSESPRPGPVGWNPPVNGSVIRVFAMDQLIWSKTLGQWMTHSGVDIACPKGSEVRAVAPGTVKRVYEDDMLGPTVVVSHDGGVTTVYSGLKKDVPVREGDKLASRALIGYIGDTAVSECSEESHLHFELHLKDKPADPCEYIVFRKE